MRSRHFGLVVLVALGLAATRPPSSRLVANLEAKQQQTVVAYGTSLTAKGAWVEELTGIMNQRYPGQVTMVNSGGSGQWSDWGVKNLNDLVIAKRPDTVFIEFGINDSVERFHCPVEQARKNLEAMIERILKDRPKCEIILMTGTPGDQFPPGHQSYRKDIDQYYEMYRQVAKQRGLIMVDLYARWQELKQRDRKLFDQYVPDSVHPTAAGCAAIATPAILAALGVPGK